MSGMRVFAMRMTASNISRVQALEPDCGVRRPLSRLARLARRLGRSVAGPMAFGGCVRRLDVPQSGVHLAAKSLRWSHISARNFADSSHQIVMRNTPVETGQGSDDMAARVIQLAEIRASRSLPSGGAAEMPGAAELAERFHFWTGASGRRYVHTVYSLVECPALPAGNYILVHRDGAGQRTVLSIGRAIEAAPSLNLAEIRRRGAELGANEVHVHLLASNAKLSQLVEFDLRSGQDADSLVSASQH